MPTLNPDPPASAVDPNLTITRLNTVSGLVETRMNSMTSYATAAWGNAINYVDQLKTQAATIATLPAISTTISDPAITLTAFAKPTVPVEPANMTFASPTAPAQPALPAGASDPLLIVPSATIDAGTAPAFTAAAPTLNEVAAPGALVATIPAAPVVGDVAVPAPPDLVLPAVPTLAGITLPSVPALTIATFADYSITPPAAPAGDFSFVEPQYNATLLNLVRSKLEAFVNGEQATGLTPAVEQAIWNRARDRENVAAQRKAKEAVRQFAQRGFMKPPGALAVEMMEATQEAINKSSDVNRDIMVKQADLEQNNRKWAFEQAFQVESKFIEYSNLMAQRAFEAARFVQDIAMQIYQAAISKYNGDISLMGQKLEAYKQNVAAELYKLDLYKTQLEGAKIAGELNMQEVEMYKTRIEGAKTIVDIYRTEVEAAKAKAEVNKSRIDAFAAEVGAYGELVKAKTSEYQGYETRVRAEIAKIDMFKGQADAYRSQVDGFKTLVDAKIAQKQAEIQTGVQVPLDLFRARAEMYRTSVEAEAQRVQSLSNTYDQRTRIFVAQAQGEAARVQADTGAYAAQAQIKLAQANLTLEQARNNVQAMIQKSQMITQAIQSGTQTSAQIAASALASVHMSAGISDSFAQGFSQQVSHSTSNSYNGSESVQETIAPAETV